MLRAGRNGIFAVGRRAGRPVLVEVPAARADGRARERGMGRSIREVLHDVGGRA
jgi:hypothetical protein